MEQKSRPNVVTDGQARRLVLQKTRTVKPVLADTHKTEYSGPMNRRALHPVQEKLLKLLAENVEEPLTVRELQDLVGASSTSVVAHHVSQLEKKGYLKRNPYNPRDYQVIETGPEREVALINLYGLARCGPSGSLLDGDPIDRVPIASRLLSFPAAEAFMVRAKGHSMIPRISEGDLVIARMGGEIVSGRTYVCVNNGECLIKVIRDIDDKWFLESFNREKFPIFAAANDLRVEGEVKQILSGKL